MGVVGAGVYLLSILSIWPTCCSTAGVLVGAIPRASSLLSCEALWSEGDAVVVGEGGALRVGGGAVGDAATADGDAAAPLFVLVTGTVSFRGGSMESGSVLE